MVELSVIPASIKYRLRRPSIAKMFDVITMNGSVVIARTAGIESIANTRSVTSTMTRATASGWHRGLHPSTEPEIYFHTAWT